ncbi:MAG: hypothetical protein OEZ06_14555 [Myxococcales bacterium]|nr:hypothetical protein [Myxococcales bacterium]
MAAPMRPCRPMRHRTRRDQEGAVMLVVLLVLMFATAGATISVRVTQAEFRAAGDDRMALQAQYLAEAAMSTALAYVDMQANRGLLTLMRRAQGLPGEPSPLPSMAPEVAEPEILTGGNSRNAVRFPQPSLELPLLQPGGEWPAMAAANVFAADALGSTGPLAAQVPERYLVDLTDCQLMPAALQPGAPIGGGRTGQRVVQFSCVLTARTRLTNLDAAGNAVGMQYHKDWLVDPANTLYYHHDPYGSVRESRASVLLPQMLQ